MTIYPNRRSNAGLGWLVSLGRLFRPNVTPTQENPYWSYETPDGALHSFHSGLHVTPVETTPEYCAQNGVQCYTRDGSYLRMTTSANGADHTIEFPDGTSQIFREVLRIDDGNTWSDTPGTGRWRLREIKDRFANTVSISYSSTAANPEIWKIDDGTRIQRVYFVPAPSPPYDDLVDRVVLTTFGVVGQTSEWKMGYDFRDIGRGGGFGRSVHYQPRFYADVPLVTSFTLPAVNSVKQVYSMLDSGGSPAYHVEPDNDHDGVPDFSSFNGVLTALQLPTKGWLEWNYALYTFLGSSDESIHRAIAVTTRSMLDASHANAKTWQYGRQHSDILYCPVPGYPDQAQWNPPEQLVVSVTSPEPTTSVHYFSILSNGVDMPCGASA